MNHVESEGYALRWLTGSVYVVSRREEEERIWCEFFWRIVSSLETKPTSQDRESAILLNEYLSTLEADIKVNMVYIYIISVQRSVASGSCCFYSESILLRYLPYLCASVKAYETRFLTLCIFLIFNTKHTCNLTTIIITITSHNYVKLPLIIEENFRILHHKYTKIT